MSNLMHLVIENYNDIVETKKDPVVDSWLLMNSPVPVVTIVVLYLYYILSWGPKHMEKRKPYDLKTLILFYNAYQVIFSLWLCSNILRIDDLFYNVFYHSCRSNTYNKDFRYAASQIAWWYFFSKVVELLDTVFFVLRKKQSQISFLHVYHHTIMTLFSWAYLKFLPGEQGVFIGFINSAVHVVMYAYYLIAALGPQYQKYLWWKKYMTVMQLAQFCIILLYLMITTAMDCKVPKALTYFFAGNTSIFLYLFADFYRQAYKKKADISAQKELKSL